jgi:hypothetical protein
MEIYNHGILIGWKKPTVHPSERQLKVRPLGDDIEMVPEPT